MPWGCGAQFGIGTSDRFNVPAFASPHAGPHSIWVRHFRNARASYGSGGAFALAVGSQYGLTINSSGLTCTYSINSTVSFLTDLAWAQNKWVGFGVRADGSSSANDPTVFQDGAKKTVGSGLTQSGADANYASISEMSLGNRGGLARPSGGLYEDFAVWSVELSDEEFALLDAGVSPAVIRPDALVIYFPLDRRSNIRCAVSGISLGNLAACTYGAIYDTNESDPRVLAHLATRYPRDLRSYQRFGAAAGGGPSEGSGEGDIVLGAVGSGAASEGAGTGTVALGGVGAGAAASGEGVGDVTLGGVGVGSAAEGAGTGDLVLGGAGAGEDTAGQGSGIGDMTFGGVGVGAAAEGAGAADVVLGGTGAGEAIVAAEGSGVGNLALGGVGSGHAAQGSGAGDVVLDGVGSGEAIVAAVEEGGGGPDRSDEQPAERFTKDASGWRKPKWVQEREQLAAAARISSEEDQPDAGPRRASPVAESLAPAVSDSGNAGVAPGLERASPQPVAEVTAPAQQTAAVDLERARIAAKVRQQREIEEIMTVLMMAA